MAGETEHNYPAFPCPEDAQHYRQNGMSLRDWFAGQSIAGVMQVCSRDTIERGGKSEYFARLSYEIADAMLRARETTP